MKISIEIVWTEIVCVDFSFTSSSTTINILLQSQFKQRSYKRFVNGLFDYLADLNG